MEFIHNLRELEKEGKFGAKFHTPGSPCNATDLRPFQADTGNLAHHNALRALLPFPYTPNTDEAINILL
jgi:hypothetical protein